MCWVWQHNSALGNLAQQAQKINNARKVSCKPGLQLFAGCRIEKNHSSTTKHNPKSPIHFSTIAPQLCSRQVLPFSPLTFASDNFFSNSDSQGTPSSSSLSLDRRHGSITTGTHPVHPLSHKEQVSVLHGVHCVLNDLYPAIALFFGAGVDLHHFRILSTHADQEQTLLFMSHFSYNQLLQRDHSGFLVLQMERNG